MNVKIVNKSNREIPEEFIISVNNNEGYDRYQDILEQYNLKFSEIDIDFKEDITTLYIADRKVNYET